MYDWNPAEFPRRLRHQVYSRALSSSNIELYCSEGMLYVHICRYLSGFVGDVRPLHALEIAHLYDNIENNVTSKALIMAFSQVAKNQKVRDIFVKGKDLTHKAVEHYIEKLHRENLPAPEFIDHLVTTSTFAPFSDKLMLFHKVDMFSMKIRAFGNSLAVNGLVK